MFLDSLFPNNQIVSSKTVSRIIRTYAREDNWHNLDEKNGNLGYGLIHYSLIRIFQPKKILVIGSKYGFIPAICAAACRDNKYGKVDFVDASYDINDANDVNHWGGVGFWKKIDPKKHFGKLGIEKYIEVHVMTSQDFAKKHSKEKWDYLYIDGDHSYKGIKSDFSLFGSKISKAGIVAIHDIFSKDESSLEYGVIKFWKELKKEKKYACFEFPGQYGLGILQRSASAKK